MNIRVIYKFDCLKRRSERMYKYVSFYNFIRICDEYRVKDQLV